MNAPSGAPSATIGAAASQFSKAPGCNPPDRFFTTTPRIEVNAMMTTEVGMAILRSARQSKTSAA